VFTKFLTTPLWNFNAFILLLYRTRYVFVCRPIRLNTSTQAMRQLCCGSDVTVLKTVTSNMWTLWAVSAVHCGLLSTLWPLIISTLIPAPADWKHLELHTQMRVIFFELDGPLRQFSHYIFSCSPDEQHIWGNMFWRYRARILYFQSNEDCI